MTNQDQDAAQALGKEVLEFLDDPFAQWSDHLSAKELETLYLVGRGLGATQIGEALQLTRQAVHYRLTQALIALKKAGGPDLQAQDVPGWIQDQIKELIHD